MPRTTAPVYPGQVDINEDDIIGKILNEEGNVRPGNMPASVEQDEHKEEDGRKFGLNVGRKNRETQLFVRQ